MRSHNKYYLAFMTAGFVLGLAITVRAQYKVLHHFTGGSDDGSGPRGALIKSAGVFFGMTQNGGSGDNGTVFRMNADGTEFRLLHSFGSPAVDGVEPVFGALLLSDSMLYGLATSFGTGSGGTAFRIGREGAGFEVLRRFSGSDGESPYGSLILNDTVLYGMNTYGSGSGHGTIFRMNRDGSGFQVLHTFTPVANDGGDPHGSLLCSGSVLYGVTTTGGSHNVGTIFKINTDGTEHQVLNHFSGSNGSYPFGTLIQSESILYGTTAWGGAANNGTVYSIGIGGDNFKLLRNFVVADGIHPTSSLTRSDSVLYGTAVDGGENGNGTIFKLKTDGTGFALLHRFTGSGGSKPQGDLLLSDSILYGMTSQGGDSGRGVLFALDLRLVTVVQEKSDAVKIGDFLLEQNYPNPFNPTTVIGYHLVAAGDVNVSIYNLLGQKIRTLVDAFQSAGKHSILWGATDDDGGPVSSGIYFYSLCSDNIAIQKKMILMR